MQFQVEEILNKLYVNDRLSKLAVSDTGFLFDPQTGQSFSLNLSGLQTLNYLKQGLTVNETASRLAEDCFVSQEVAVSAVEAFVLQLGRYV